MWTALALSCLLTAAAQDAASGPPGSRQPSGSPAQGLSSPGAAAPTASSATSQSGGDLRFGPVTFAGHNNYVVRDNNTSVQIVLSDDAQTEPGQPARLITAFHRANTGALVYFVPEVNSTLAASLDQQSVHSLHDADEQRGVEGDIKFDNDFRFGVTLIGSVRTLRDYTESGGKVFNSIFNYTLGEVTESSVQLVRHWLNGTTVQYLSFSTGDNAGMAVTKRTDGPPGIRFWRKDNKNAMTLRFRSHFNWTGTTPETPWVEANGLSPEELFLKPTGGGNGTATGGPAGRPMSESTAVITATTWLAGMTTTNPIYTLQENQTRQTVPNVAFTPTPSNGTSATSSAAPSQSSQPVRSTPVNGAGAGYRTSGSTSANLNKVLSAIQGPGAGIAEQMSFLAYDTEFLAGGWRFLTYFGRDTLIAARLMLPVLSPEAVEAVLAAAIERTNSTSGELCHEETVGDYASYLNAGAGQPERGNKPVYAYTMVDTDFLLLPLVAAYATAPQGEGRLGAFLGRNSSLVAGSYRSLLRTNAEHVIALAREFAVHPRRENLVAVRSYPVGNWRDSAAGLGWGRYPFDVNVALVPAALRAIAQLHDAGLLDGERFGDAARMAQRWEEKALKYFHVNIAHEKSQERLDNYVRAANLSDSLLYGAGSLNGSQTADGYNAPGWAIGVPNKTADANERRDGDGGHGDDGNDEDEGAHGDEGDGEDGGEGGGRPSSSYPPSERDTYYALSLLENLRPVHVQHSDLSFLLLYGSNVAREAVHATVQALQPYPRGLLTNAGMLVANPAFSWNASAATMFSNRAYHGAVAWGWQQGMMAAGVARQLALCGLGGSSLEAVALSSAPGGREPGNGTQAQPAWCADRALVLALHAAQGRLWDAIAGSKDVLYTEVWSPVFVPRQPRQGADATEPAAGDAAPGGSFAIGDLGKLSPEGTEGDAIQLWSYGFLAQIDPRTGTPVASWAASGDAGGQGAAESPGSAAGAAGQGSGASHGAEGKNGTDTGNGVGGVTNATAKESAQ